MLNESKQVFDEHMIASGGVLPSTATASAGLVHSEKFSKADLIGIFIVVNIPATGLGTVEAQIEHCSDGVHWQNKNDTEEINKSSWPGVGERAVYGGETAPARPTLEFVRLRITLTGFASRVKAYMVGRLKEEPKQACSCSAGATSPIEVAPPELDGDGIEPPPDPDDEGRFGNAVEIGGPSPSPQHGDPQVLDAPFGNGHTGKNFIISRVPGGSVIEQAGDEATIAVSPPTDDFKNGRVVVAYGNNGLHISTSIDASLTRFSALSVNSHPHVFPCPPGVDACHFGNDHCTSSVPRVLTSDGAVISKSGRFAVTSFGPSGVSILASDDFGATWSSRSVSDADRFLHPDPDNLSFSADHPDHPWHTVDASISSPSEQCWRQSIAVDKVRHRLCVSWASTDKKTGVTHQRALIQSYDPSQPMAWIAKPFDVSVDDHGERGHFLFTDPRCHTWDWDLQAALPDGRFLVTWADGRTIAIDTAEPSKPEVVVGCSQIFGAILSPT